MASLSSPTASSVSSISSGSPQEEDFGLIRPSLMRQLRSILDQYPDDGQILKELLQNAEDAHASVVRFLHDEHEHCTDTAGLYHPGLAKYQGPALYAYNDARFDDTDWTGIRMLQDSIKEKDPMKVGRFGLGFKSVLHMTDLPSVISGDRLAVIDPHEKFFMYQGQATTGYSWNLTQRAADIKLLPNQFSPYKGLFGCNDICFEKGFYPGTFFRFPLRNEPSELSETVYNSEKVDQLFSSFKRDAHLMLIFLKSVEIVELYKRNKDQTEPKLQFRVSVSPDCLAQVQQKRKSFLSLIDHTRWMEKPLSISYPLMIDTILFNKEGNASKQSFLYLVTEYFAGGQVSVDLKALSKDPILYYLPLVGLAMPVTTAQDKQAKKEDVQNANDEKEVDKEDENAPTGQVFCFLPLPIEQKSSTGLPVHVNGYFSISQNRRHLKWPTAGQSIKTDKVLMWNHCLLSELIPMCYVELILAAINYCERYPRFFSHEHVMAAIPNLLTVNEKWQAMLQPFFTVLFQYKVFFTRARLEGAQYMGQQQSAGRWIALNECIFDCMREQQLTKQTVKEVLTKANVQVVEIPMCILHALGAYGCYSPETITPSLVRGAIRRRPDSYGHLSRADRLVLLGYVLKDEDFPDLEGLQMLPLTNGQFDIFTHRPVIAKVYIPSKDHPRVLLPGMERSLLMDELGEAVANKLNKLANEGCCQLRHLDKTAVMNMLPGLIPKDWFMHPVITYDPAKPPSPSYPPREWFQHLWRYLRLHYPGDLSIVAGLPILPSLENENLIELIPLTLPSVAVMTSAMGTTLTSECSKILQVCGLYMIAKLPEYVETHAAVIGNYVRLPVPEDVLDALDIVFRKKKAAEQQKKIKEVTSVQEKRQLRMFLSRVNPKILSESHREIIRSLPIFELFHQEDEEQPEEFVSLLEVGKAAPLNIPSILVNCRLVNLRESDARILAAVVGVTPLPMSALLKETVLEEFIQGKWSPEGIQPVIKYIVQQLPLLMAEDPTFLNHLRSVPFVSITGGQLAKPCDLFNPQSDFLRKLFYGEDVFPGDEYNSESCLGLLRQLGLRERPSVKPIELLYCSQHIEQLSAAMGKDDEELLAHLTAKAEMILIFLNKNPRILNEDVNGVPMVIALRNTGWVRTEQKRPTLFPDSLAWFESPTRFSRPSDVKPSGWFPLVGSVMSLIKVSSVSKDVSTAFNWHLPPPIDMIIEQLGTVIQSYRSEDKTKYMAIITSIYDELSQRNHAQVMDSLVEKGLKTWIWHGDGFTTSDKITIKRPFMDLKPYIYTLPTEIQQYTKMFYQCGVKMDCDDVCLVNILQQVKDKHKEGDAESEGVKHDLQLVVDILNKIQNNVSNFDEDLRNKVLIPQATEMDTTLNMIAIDEATYCDTEWLRQGFDMMEFDEQDGISFIHPWMPTTTAATLDVPTLMSRMLHAEELNVTGFGQSEPLTSRLKRLLEDYTDGLAIPKELIQNADDAGATEISFLYDERPNDDHMKYLIDEGMKECHGPALWVHNNAVFSDMDFESITKLGGATKEVQSDKIGKFGLGFNAVYNLTDVPSFISRNYIVIFDPHTRHLGLGIKDRSRPGIRIDMMKNKTLLRKLPDQFQPYNGLFGCSIGVDKEQLASYNGTLFRMPLRTRQQAAKSEISNVHYDQQEMKKLLQMLVRSSPHLLLFTQNVTSIKVYYLKADESADDVKLMYHLKKESVKVSRPLTNIAIKPPAATSRSALQVVATKATGEFNMLCRGKNFLERVSKSRAKKLINEYDAPAVSLVVELSVQVEDDAKLLFQPPPLSGDYYWLISFATGYERSLQVALESMTCQKGYNPMAAVAVALKKTENGFIPMALAENKGIVFCYLPLPTLSGLPVHINGSFAVQSDRRHLTERTEDDKDTSPAEWNEALLQDAVCRSYHQMIRDAQVISPACTQVKYYNLWPCQADVLPIMRPLMKHFYDQLIKNPRVPTWYDGSILVTLDRAVFLDPALASKPKIAELAIESFKQNDTTSNVVDLPTKVMESLVAVGHGEFIKEKTYTQGRFFRQIFFTDMVNLTPDVRNPLILYALDMNHAMMDKLLAKHACIPASPNGTKLRQPCELVHPLLPVAKLYSPDDERFPHGSEFQVTQRLVSLQKLGMQYQDLTWADIVERAKSISALAKIDHIAAKIRLRHFLNFLDRKLNMLSHSKQEFTEDKAAEYEWAQDQLRQTEMFPLMRKPANFPLPWKGDEYEDEEGALWAPDDVHLLDARYLLSSTQHVVDDSSMSSQVKTFLGMTNREIAIEHVTTQLEHALIVDPKTLTTRAAQDDVNKICFKIYDFLQMKCMEEEDTAGFVTAALQDRKCIIVADEYLMPSQLSFSSSINCAPYLYGLPPNMARRFKPLFKMLGVREQFSISEYMTVNHELHQSSAHAPLKGKDLDLALSSLAILNSSMKEEGLSAQEVERKYGEIYIPNVAGVLQPASDLCFNDCPWLQATGNMNFTHTGMTYEASALLGVKTKRQEALSKHAHGIPFGQKERLTNGLKRILRSYPCDHEILKELIQNADDAEATEIHFVKDARHHSERHVFENSWKPLQGPALCVYNNKPFKTSDLEGIQNLGEGSKVQDPNRTGQYGIGFSSVYHLTDAPSLLTSGDDLGEKLCVFDPHCLYVPGATPAEPGMQFSDLKTLRETFPDVFSCYLEDVFKLNNATLFRFPLRTTDMALKSELSMSNITMSKVHSLLSKLKTEAFEILLFTNNITRISISDIETATGQLVNAYSVWAELSVEDEANRHSFYKYVKSCAADLKDETLTIDQIESRSVTYTVKVSDTTGGQEAWVVSQQIGIPKDITIPESVLQAFENRELMLLPRGGTACLLERRLHGKIDLDNRPRRVFCFLPLPVETSLPVQINGHFALGYENRRHLWTNADGSGYKQDWNDFLCSEVISVSYLNLMMYIRMKSLNTQVQDNVATVVCTKVLLESAIKAYQQYFPNFDDLKPQWNPLVRGFYQKSAALQKCILPTMRETQGQCPVEGASIGSQYWDVTWLPPIGQGIQKAFFSKIDELQQVEQQTSSLLGKFKSFFRAAEPTAIKPDSQVLKEVLLDCDFKVLEVTPTVLSNYTRSEVDIDFMSPEGVLLFFQSYSTEEPMCNLGPLPNKLAHTPFRDTRTFKIVFNYCKKDPEYLRKLNGTPLLLTNDGLLRVFDGENPVFYTKYYDLIPKCGHLFLHRIMQTEILKDISITGAPVLAPLTIEAMNTMLEYHLPKDKYHAPAGPVRWSRSSYTEVVSVAWIQNLWTFIQGELEPVLQDRDLEGEEKQEQLLGNLKPLEDWAIIPANTAKASCLLSLKNATDVTDLRFSMSGVRDVVRHLQLPELAVDVLNKESSRNSDLLHRMVTTLDRPMVFLQLIHRTVNKETSTVKLLPKETYEILKYFSENVDQFKENTEKAVELLLALPFYQTIHGDLIILTDCLVYTLPAKIPTNDIDIWQSKSGTVFLERNDTLQPLYDFLGCAMITTVDVYCKFILQHFEYFSPDARTVHLQHLYHQYLKDNPIDNIMSETEISQLLQALQDLNFIEDKEGDLHSASEFYDPENVLFRVMLPEEKLPPRAGIQFKESEWLSFLRKLGLQSNVTKEQVVSFAQQVEHEGKESTGNSGAIVRSKVLTEHLLKMQNAYRDEILEEVSDIKFVAPEQVNTDLSAIYGQYGDLTSKGHLPYVSFKVSHSKDYEQLLWTRASILPSWADPMKQDLSLVDRMELMQCLGIHIEPPASLVVSHLITLCDHISSDLDVSLKTDLKKKRMLKEVFRSVYRFLQDKGIDDEDVKDRLSKIPCILVEDARALIEPCYTAMNMYESEEIRHYLYKVPLDLGEFHLLFQCLGSSDTPTVDQYASVLERIHNKVGTQRLTPNELMIAYKAVKGIFTALENTSSRDINTASLFLPSEAARLVESSSVVFNDTPDFYDRVQGFGLQFLFDVKECGIKFTNIEDLLAHLPKRLCPGMLSTHVKETLVDKAKQSITQGSTAEQLGKRLTCEGFMRAVIRLIRHETHRCGRKLDDSLMFSFLDRLSTIRVYAADLLQTQLTYNNRPIKGSKVEKNCFVEKISGRPDIWNVYIRNNASLEHDLVIPLAEVINSILSGVLHDSVLYLLPILVCSEEKIQSKLNSLNVRLDQSQATTQAPTLPTPGTAIHADHVGLLGNTSGASFSTNEYVAYKETVEAEPRYAIIIEQIMPDAYGTVSEPTYLVNLGECMDCVISSADKLQPLSRS